MSAAWEQQSGSSPAAALLIRKKASGKSAQPLRCGVQPCNAFGADCGVTTASNAWTPGKKIQGDMSCVTNKCYNGKCASGSACRAEGEVCYTYAPHSCCTGQCNGVPLYNDCLRLLGLSHDITTHGGIAVDRQCEVIGTCANWPGMPPGPTDLLTPWAVPADDDPSKYYMMKGISFASNVAVEVSKFVARNTGQLYTDVPADSTRPASMSDAGAVRFTDDSVVATDMWTVYQEGMEPNPVVKYCLAPILRNGAGGGFYAVGKDCCDKEQGFKPCLNQGHWNEAGGEYQHQEVIAARTGLILAQQEDKFAKALQLCQAKYGKKFQGGGKGVETPAPYYVRMVADWEAERAAPSPAFVYVTPLKPTYCVAPIGLADGSLPDMVRYFAVGKDCCRLGGSFDCGPVGTIGLSGKTDTDVNGEYLLAVKMTMVRFGLSDAQVHRRPLFVKWTEERLVQDPHGVGPHGGELLTHKLAGTR